MKMKLGGAFEIPKIAAGRKTRDNNPLRTEHSSIDDEYKVGEDLVLLL